MKWETVKKQVAGRVYSHILEGRSFETMATILLDALAADKPVTAHTTFKEYADKAWEIVMDWDIRCAGRLREVFPGFFPPSLSKGNLIATMDDRGDWLIETT